MKILSYKDRLDGIPVTVMQSHDATVGLHKHDFFEFVYVLSGRAEHIFENKNVTLSEGDYFLINLKSPHEYRRIADDYEFSVINILFLPQFLDESLKDAASFQEIVDNHLIRYGYNPLGELPTQKIFHDDTGTVGMLAKSTLQEFSAKRTGYEDVLRHLLHSLVIYLVREETARFAIGTDNTVRRIKEYVASHYMNPLRLSDICERMSFSLSYISTLFREKTGMTFRDYVLNVRMERACSLLSSSEMTVQSIAALVGYSDPAFFYKTFKRRIGKTPEAYRESLGDTTGQASE